MSTYILQKDLPNLKSGIEFIWDEKISKYKPYFPNGKGNKYSNFKVVDIALSKEEVESNNEWFTNKKPIEPPLMTFSAASKYSTGCLILENRSNISHAIRNIDGNLFTKANIVLNLSSQTHCNQAIEFLNVLGRCLTLKEEEVENYVYTRYNDPLKQKAYSPEIRKSINEEKKYSIKDMQDCFDAARKIKGKRDTPFKIEDAISGVPNKELIDMVNYAFGFKENEYPLFNDYVNSLNSGK